MAGRDSEGEEDFAISEDLIQSPTHKAATTSTIDFDGLLPLGLTLHQNLANGNGGQAWPAGVVLASVELGAGSGLVGLAVAVGCGTSKTVHITDQEPMLELMRENVALNRLEGKVAAHVYDWGEACPSGVPDHPDVILAADCVYFEPAFPLLQQTLQDLIGPETVCYFCFKKRRRADQHFMKAVKKTFLIERVENDPDQQSYARENIFLYTIRKKKNER